MIGLQSFAFLVLAGLTQVYSSDAEKDYEYNSFPYYHIIPDPKQDDLYTSYVVSTLSGPLCSGFHVKPNAVITAASCVHRETADSLVVISHNINGINQTMEPALTFLNVKKIISNSKYNRKTQEHDVAVLEVEHPQGQVPTLLLPGLDSVRSSKVTPSTVYIAKYSFEETLQKFYSKFYPVDAQINIDMCTNRTYEPTTFYCVYLTNDQPYSYGVTDIGTPLIFRDDRGDIAQGMFTGHLMDVPEDTYLYQNFLASLGFLTETIKSLGK